MKKYKIIYADPPWPIKIISRKLRPKQLVPLNEKSVGDIALRCYEHAGGGMLYLNEKMFIKEVCKTFGTPSITKEQMLAILPEIKEYCDKLHIQPCGCGATYVNEVIDQMKKRIEEMFNE